MANITMNAKDAVSAKLAECYVTIEGRRYLLMQGKDFEAKFEKTKKEIDQYIEKVDFEEHFLDSSKVINRLERNWKNNNI